MLRRQCLRALQSALFNFQAFLTVLLLSICTCAFLHGTFAKGILDRHQHGYAYLVAQMRALPSFFMACAFPKLRSSTSRRECLIPQVRWHFLENGEDWYVPSMEASRIGGLGSSVRVSGIPAAVSPH